MKEIRILITEDYDWDDGDWDYLESQLRQIMNQWLAKTDYTYAVWDVE